MDTKDINDVLAFFERTSDQFFSKDEFRAKLASGKKLRIKYGVDVTAPTLHIGHAVNLWLMRHLQDRGHRVVFLIGDFTTRIGDPDGKLETRPQIARADIERNAQRFIEQARLVLRFDDPALLEIRRNSDWLDALPLQQFLDLLAQVTHAKLISRDMFQKRIENQKEIHMHEMLYPVLQGWDSVAVASDLTIIGSDQLFNEMMGRFFQERHGQKPQTIVTTKITAGTDGKHKQSKSLGNYVGLADSPRDKFGRVMSIPDQIMEDWFVVYTDLPMTEIAELKKTIKKDPREAKLRLAAAIVARYHGTETGRAERDWFENAFSKGNVPDDIPALPVITPRIGAFELVRLTRADKSRGDTRRLIKQGGVSLNGEKLRDPDEELLVQTNDILKVGKRHWYRIEIVSLHEIETDRLWLKPLEIQDIDLLVKYLPEWEIVKYLTRPIAARVAPAQRGGPSFEMLKSAPAAATRVADTVAREVFRKVIGQPEPKDEWLWKILPKEEPERIIGVAHLRRDFEFGNQNVWLDPEERGKDYAREVATALNTHAFEELNFSTIVVKDAFGHAARDIENLREHFTGQRQLQTQNPPDQWHVTRETWPRNHPPGPPAAAFAPAAEPLANALAQIMPGQPLPPVLPGQPVTALPPGVPPPPGWVPGMPLPPNWPPPPVDPQAQTLQSSFPGATPGPAASPAPVSPVTAPQAPQPAPQPPKLPPGKT